MEFRGTAAFEEFWMLLKDESPRGLTVVIAAYFDEELGKLLGRSRGSFDSKIDNGLLVGLLSPNEYRDLHVIRKLRNGFAHNLRSNSFDSAKTTEVESLETWKTALSTWPAYRDLLPIAKDRLLYVAGVLAARLKVRRGVAVPPLVEPDSLDRDAWPPITSI